MKKDTIFILACNQKDGTAENLAEYYNSVLRNKTILNQIEYLLTIVTIYRVTLELLVSGLSNPKSFPFQK